jgi:hypothetical protein
MGTLQTSLRNVGLISERSLRETEASVFLHQEGDTARATKALRELEKRLEIMRSTSSPPAFRREARKVLLQNPDSVHEILRIAHAQGMQNRKSQGGTWLVANLYQVREILAKQKMSYEEKTAFVDKNFAKK